MRALAIVLLLGGCQSAPPAPHAPASSAPPPPPAAAPSCGGGTCAPSEICVPGGTTRNGVGATIQLPAEHCAPLPASCKGAASCSCVDQLCPIGHCASTDGGRLVCLAG